MKPAIRLYIIAPALLYLLLWGVADLRYEHQIDRLLSQSDSLVHQLEAKDPAHLRLMMPTHQEKRRPAKPSLFHPKHMITALFSPEMLGRKTLEPLQSILMTFKNDLAGLDFSDMDLRHLDLRESNLRGAVFTRATLIGTKLNQADLSGADFREARLKGADLTEATLIETDLSSTDFRKATFKGALFRGVNFFYADFQGADFSEAQLMGETLSAADFRKVNFSKADLSNAVLSGARLDGARFTDAKLKEADLRYTDLSQSLGLKTNQFIDPHIDHNTKLPDTLLLPDSTQ